MNPFLIEKYQDRLATNLVEVSINNASGTYYLPDDAILRNCDIVGLILPDNADDTVLSPQSQRPLVSNEVLRASFLTMKDVNAEVIQKHPLNDFLTTSQAGDIRLLLLHGFNPQKSFIELSNPALITTGESFLLHFLYVTK